MAELTYLSPSQVARRLGFSTRYFRNVVMRDHLLEGVHYCRPFGGRKILLVWEEVEAELLRDLPGVKSDAVGGASGIPMSGGRVCHV